MREGQELLLISMLGQVIRIKVASIRRQGRSTEGVRLMVLGDDDQVSGIAPVEEGSGPDDFDGDIGDADGAGDAPPDADPGEPDEPPAA